MAMTYQERKAQGKRKSAEYTRRVHHAKDLAIVFRGIGAGVGFMFVMGVVSNADRVLELALLVVYAVVIYFSMFIADYVVFRAEQTRFPKSRRWRLRDLYRT